MSKGSFVLLAAVLLVVGGCGGTEGKPSTPSQQNARVTVRFKWPAPTRVIPTAANSLVVGLKMDGTMVTSGPIARPTDTWSSPVIPPGAYTVSAEAFPTATATGVGQAMGTGTVTVVNGQNASATVTMASTVTALTISPSAATVSVGATATLTASASDSAGDIVVVAPATVQWTSTATSVATVSATGVSATVKGIASGTSKISALFTEVEPKLGQKPVSASAVVVTVKAVTGLAPSAWPKFGADYLNSGRGQGAGATGVEQWAYNAGKAGGPPNGGAAIGADGTIYFGSPSHFVALNPSGTLKWEDAIATYLSVPAIASDGTIYTTSTDNDLYALNPDGSTKWTFVVGNCDDGVSPAIGHDGTIYVASNSGKLYAINPNGSQKWVAASTLGYISVPAIGTDGTIYVGSTDGYLYAYSPAGPLKWKAVKAGTQLESPSVGPDGTIYIQSEDGLYAVASSGAVKWTLSLGSPVSGTSPAIAANGTIYAVTLTTLYAVSPTGTEDWQQAIATSHSGPAIASDGTIYVGTDGGLRAISSSGNLNLTFAPPTASLPIMFCPAIAANGVVYSECYDDNLYAVK